MNEKLIMPTQKKKNEIEKQRKKYDKFAKKTAKKENSLGENLFKTRTTTTKEDVIEIDAHIENNARRIFNAGDMDEKEFNKIVNNSLEFSKAYSNIFCSSGFKLLSNERYNNSNVFSSIIHLHNG